MSAAHASFVVAADHPCLPGHFPGDPLVPGVVIVGHVVDAIEAVHGPLGALRLPQVKFMQPLRPQETATVALQAMPGDGGRWRFRVERGDVLLASGEIAAGNDGIAA